MLRLVTDPYIHQNASDLCTIELCTVLNARTRLPLYRDAATYILVVFRYLSFSVATALGVAPAQIITGTVINVKVDMEVTDRIANLPVSSMYLSHISTRTLSL